MDTLTIAVLAGSVLAFFGGVAIVVVQVMQAGFKIGDRVLRPALVGVAKAAG